MYSGFLLLFCILSRIINVLGLEGEGIVGGDISPDGQFPYHVSVQRYGKHICGGGILDPFHIITAAHCLTRLDPKYLYTGPMQVMGGVNFLDMRSSAREVSHVVASYIPREYFVNFRTEKTGDIAILKVNQALNLVVNPQLDYLLLPVAPMDLDGKSAVVTGFGVTSMSLIANLDTNKIVREGVQDGYLHYAYTTIMSNKECSIEKSYNISESRLCARIIGYDEGDDKGVCSGDSGSPLVVDGNMLVGVVSVGDVTCDETIRPTVYTRVSSFSKFISGVLDGKVKPIMEYEQPPHTRIDILESEVS